MIKAIEREGEREREKGGGGSKAIAHNLCMSLKGLNNIELTLSVIIIDGIIITGCAVRSCGSFSNVFNNPRYLYNISRISSPLLSLVTRIQFVTLIACDGKVYREIIKKLASPINEKRLSISQTYRDGDWHRHDTSICVFIKELFSINIDSYTAD